MITVFNRQELFVTQSMEQYAKVSAALDAAGIEYYAKAFGRSSQFGERSHRGSLGQVAALDNFYKVYVKKSDYELAENVLMMRGLDYISLFTGYATPFLWAKAKETGWHTCLNGTV